MSISALVAKYASKGPGRAATTVIPIDEYNATSGSLRKAGYRARFRGPRSIAVSSPCGAVKGDTLKAAATGVVLYKVGNTAVKPKTVTKPVKATGKVSNATLIREKLAAGATFDEAVEYGVNELGMKRALARTYVKNNS